MNKKIIIFASHDDPHVNSVQKQFKNLDINYHIISHNKSYDYNIFQQENSLNIPILDDVSLIWNRIKLFIPVNSSGERFQEEYVKTAGWLDLYNFLSSYARIKKIRIVNIPRIGYGSKIICSQIAFQSDFKIPASIIPSNLKSLLNFFHVYQSIIIKIIRTANIPEESTTIGGTMLSTNKLTKEDIDQMTEEELTICPQLFQQEIKKKIELRVVATKEKIFTYAIDSQKYELTSVDWRHGNSFLPFTPIKEYDEYLFPRIKKYFAKTGLIYGSFDFIVTRENEIYFLECNQEGQWYWLEEQNHEGIPQAIAEAIFKAIPQ